MLTSSSKVGDLVLHERNCMALHHPFFFNFYFEIIVDLQVIVVNNICVPFIQSPPVVTSCISEYNLTTGNWH